MTRHLGPGPSSPVGATRRRRRPASPRRPSRRRAHRGRTTSRSRRSVPAARRRRSGAALVDGTVPNLPVLFQAARQGNDGTRPLPPSRGKPRGGALQAIEVASRQADRSRVSWVTDSRIADPARSWQLVNREASKMNLICKWVHADDGALVMEWTKAGDSEVRWGTGGNEVAYDFEVFDHHADALTPVGV